jgi:NAD(P)H-nitrite reductase large subunit
MTMTAQALGNRQQNSPDHFDVIVVGSGPVGMRFVQQMLKLDAQCRLAIFGDEPWQPYNRV